MSAFALNEDREYPCQAEPDTDLLRVESVANTLFLTAESEVEAVSIELSPAQARSLAEFILSGFEDYDEASSPLYRTVS